MTNRGAERALKAAITRAGLAQPTDINWREITAYGSVGWDEACGALNVWARRPTWYAQVEQTYQQSTGDYRYFLRVVAHLDPAKVTPPDGWSCARTVKVYRHCETVQEATEAILDAMRLTGTGGAEA